MTDDWNDPRPVDATVRKLREAAAEFDPVVQLRDELARWAFDNTQPPWASWDDAGIRNECYEQADTLLELPAMVALREKAGR